jgi:hypothetical protein
MAITLLIAAALIRGCKFPDLGREAILGATQIRNHLIAQYDSDGAGISIPKEKVVLITLINPAAYNLQDRVAQETVAREIAQDTLDQLADRHQIEEVRVQFDRRLAAGSPVSDQIVFNFPVSELRR